MNGIVNHPTDAESEQLALLTEEMGESAQIIGKIGRHGLDSRHPDGGPNNVQMLETEIGHVLAAIDVMIERGTMDRSMIEASRFDKLRSVQKWLHCEENVEAARDALSSIESDRSSR